MDSLNQIHFLYQYSLQFFLDIFSSVLLNNPKLDSLSDYNTRLTTITKDLFAVSNMNVFLSVKLFFNYQMFDSDELVKFSVLKLTN